MSTPQTEPDGQPQAAGFAVQTTGLTVDFGDTRALDGIDLTLPAGAITGLLGRNGSGKTTLLTTLAAHRRPQRRSRPGRWREPVGEPAPHGGNLPHSGGRSPDEG